MKNDDFTLNQEDIEGLLKHLVEPLEEGETKEKEKGEPICPNFGKGQRKLNQEEIDKLIKLIFDGNYPDLVFNTFKTVLEKFKDGKIFEQANEEESKMDNIEYFSNKIVMALAVPINDYEEIVENSPTKKLFSVGRKIIYDNKIVFHFWFKGIKQLPTTQELNYLKNHLPLNHNFMFVGGFSADDNFYSVSYRTSSNHSGNHDLSHFFRISSKILISEELADALKDIEKEQGNKDELIISSIEY